MKKKFITAAICAVVASFALAHGAYNVDASPIFEQEATQASAFWKKKEAAPEVAPEEAKPEDTAPTNAPTNTEETPKQEDEEASLPVSGATLVRSTPATNHAPQTGGGNTNNHQQNRNYQGIEYVPGISEQIEKILAHSPAIKLDPNAYIVQHDESLWLVMGNIRAKLDILIYVDGKHVGAGFPAYGDHGNALPIYK